MPQLFSTVLEAVAVSVYLKDVDMVGEPIEQYAGETFGAESFRPFVERQAGRDHDAIRVHSAG